ncbi:Gp37-like protein [Amedibacillus sp. YH-ame6]
MELLALDKDFVIVDQIVSSNIQWSRKYYEHGSFAIQIQADNYTDDMKYIYTKDRPELGMINKVSYSDSKNTKNIVISGYFVERWLNDKIVHPTFYGIGEISSVVKNMIDQYKEDIPISAVKLLNAGGKVDFQETGMELGKKANEVLQTQEMSYRVRYDFPKNEFIVEIYKGIDRTQSQSENNFVTFSTSWGNILSVKADKDNSNFKNFAVVAGEGQAEERIDVCVDLSNGGYKKKIYIDKRNERWNPTEQSREQYDSKLVQLGLENLLSYENVSNVEFEPMASSYRYLIDYDLGDKCDIMITDLHLLIEARIIGIYEVIKDSKHTITLEIGNKILKPVEKVERRIY